MKLQNIVRRTVVIAVAAAALSASAVSASGDQYTLWADTNNDLVLDTIIDTDPGLTNPFNFPVPPTHTVFGMKVLDSATNVWTTVQGTANPLSGVECSNTPIRGFRCERW